MRELLKAHLAFKNYLISGLKEYNLTHGQPKILYYIATHEGCRQIDIARGCVVESSTISSVLNKMEKKHLIEKRRLPSDRRAYGIYISEEARPVMMAVKDRFESGIKTALSGFSESERAEFENYLRRVENNLNSADDL